LLILTSEMLIWTAVKYADLLGRMRHAGFSTVLHITHIWLWHSASAYISTLYNRCHSLSQCLCSINQLLLIASFIRLWTKFHSGCHVSVCLTFSDLHKPVHNVINNLDFPQASQQCIGHHHRGYCYPSNEHGAAPMWEFQVISGLLALLLRTLPQFLLLCSQKYRQTLSSSPSSE